MKKVGILLLGVLCSCSSVSTPRSERYGADEFVIDSYRIREGKFSILEWEGKLGGDFSAEFLKEYPDCIHEDDVLQISVYHPTRQDIGQAVQQIGMTIGYRVIKGQITLPELGSVMVEGLSLDEAGKAIQKRYVEEIRDIEVFVGYKERMTRKVELAGLVQIPSVPVDGKIRLFDVLARAHVPPEANLFKSYVIRDQKLLAIDLYQLLKEGNMNYNIVMRGGDKVYIAEPASATLMVMGEVGKEQLLNLPRGSVSLREALAASGGILYTGDKSYIQVIRGNILAPKIYILSWEHVIHLPNESLLLMPGDIVYVASKPITEWNRFISQLLPSFAALEMAHKGARSVGVIIP